LDLVRGNVKRHSRQKANPKKMKKRTQKKISASLPEEVHSDVIRQLTGFDDAALRRLAAKGVIPRPKVSKWPLKETVSKLFAHLQVEREACNARLPVFDSMDACEGAGLLTKNFLQQLKAFGLSGFGNTRVDLNQVLPQIETFLTGTGESMAELKSESVSSFKEMREKYAARLAKIDFNQARGETISKSTAIDTVRELLVIHHHSYGRMIEEWPSVLAGQPAAAIRNHIAHHVEVLKSAEANSIVSLEKAKGKKPRTPSHD
jgi:hypothetical protein